MQAHSREDLKIFPSARNLLSEVDALLLDAYGVLWSGEGVFPGVLPFLEECHRLGKRIVIVSNTTRRCEPEEARYAKHGLLKKDHYDELVTSGEVLAQAWQDQGSLGRAYVLFGDHPQFGGMHRGLFAGQNIEEVATPEEADWFYLSIPHHMGADTTTLEPLLTQIREWSSLGKPVVVGNPDCYAPEGSPPRWVVRQGLVAQEMERLGVSVEWAGKPAPRIFQYALALPCLEGIAHDRIVMIGDTPDTDIRGASGVGLKSALVIDTGRMTGLLQTGQKLSSLMEGWPASDRPTWIIERLAPSN